MDATRFVPEYAANLMGSLNTIPSTYPSRISTRPFGVSINPIVSSYGGWAYAAKQVKNTSVVHSVIFSLAERLLTDFDVKAQIHKITAKISVVPDSRSELNSGHRGDNSFAANRPESALPWGGRGPGFKSRRPDELKAIGISFRWKVLADIGDVLGMGSSQ